MNTSDPLDIEIDEMQDTLDLFRTIALKDNVIDANERLVLDRIRNHRDDIAAFNRRRIAAASFERNGDSRHTRSLFKEAGTGLVDLRAERRARQSTVIRGRFPAQRDEAS